MRVPDVCEGHGCAEPVESLNVECWEITGRVLCDSCAAEEFDRRRFGLIDVGQVFFRSLPRAHGELAVADVTGAGVMRWTLADVISANRAGPGESELTLDQILEQYRPPEAQLGEDE